MALKVNPDFDLIELGGGILYAGKWTGTTPPSDGDLEDVGNCSSFKYSPKVTKKEFSSYRGSALTTARTVTTAKAIEISFTLNEISQTNLGMFLMGVIDGNNVEVLEDDDAYWAIKYVTDVASPAENHIFYGWKIDIQPAGDFEEVSLDKEKVLTFKGTCLDDTTNHATSRLGRLVKVTS